MATRTGGKFGPSARVTPANAITAVRLLATPLVLVLVVHLGVSWVAALVWVAVASTDMLDGWVARRQGATTSGAFLDPLADKVLVIGALAALAASDLVSWLPVALIAGRELLISAYRSAVARDGISVPARPLAKLKTGTQDLAVFLILLPLTGLHHASIGKGVLWVSVVLAWVSGAQYLLDSHRTATGSETVAASTSPLVAGHVPRPVVGPPAAPPHPATAPAAPSDR